MWMRWTAMPRCGPSCARGLRLDVAQLWQIGHFTADRNLPKRFAVPFFVARMPSGQTPEADNREQFEPVWVQPAQALERFQARQMPMIFPTIRTLSGWPQLRSTEAVLAAVVNGPLWKHSAPHRPAKRQGSAFYRGRSPLRRAGHGLPRRPMPAPAGLAERTPRAAAQEPAAPDGPQRQRDDRSRHQQLSGGEAATGFIAIDPGPADAAHIQRLYDAAGGDIRAIVCTHSHADHAPGAFVLQQLCQDRGVPAPRSTACRPPPRPRHLPGSPGSGTAGWRASGSALPPAGQDLPVTHTLRAVFTPGHAANHVCLVLEEDELLFSGDHILNGSTPS
jgi:glyoxylase-like metal-dependent hydrolase (beta-lactamase superfamily II)